jgi:aarF domain-containing kinase
VYGGFFTKIGQLMGTAQQMMPEAYVRAFSRTMDANPPVPFVFVRGEINRSLEASSVGAEDGGVSPYRDVFEATFLEFDETPAATASVAQVHFARLRSDGARVAVKVIVADKNVMLGDLACASATARVMSRLGLDSGVDFPTVFAAYSDVVEEEFDLAREAEKMREFATLFESRGLGDKIAVPEPRDFLCGETVLVSTRARGTKLLKTLNRARESGRRPKCPPAAAAVHAFNRSDPRCGGWDGVFHTMHLAWGAMLLRHGHFHCDPHPGNFILRADGKLAILDWGQTHSFAPPFRRHLCRLVVHMAGEHHEAIAAEVREHSQVKLERPTTEALSALCFAYFDTRATPLAECNLLDLSNSPFLKNKIVRNTREGFNVIRCVFLFRGMMAACGVEGSAVEVWESDARRALAEANEPVPSLLASRTRRAATRAWLTAQRALNVGAGARLNTLEAFVRSGNGHDVSTNANGAEDTRGSWRMGLSAASAPGTPRRMRSALW